MTTFVPKVTDAGRAAVAAAIAAGGAARITHVALGTGSYDSSATGAGRTTMVARVETATVSGGGSVPGTTSATASIQALFPSWGGSAYNVTEIGFWIGSPTAGGTLFAVWSGSGVIATARSAIDYVAAFSLQMADLPASSVSVTIDPSGAAAAALVGAHETASNPHPVYATDADLIAHLAAPDPHPVYAKDTDLTAQIAAHAAASDPHPVYALRSGAISAPALASDGLTFATTAWARFLAGGFGHIVQQSASVTLTASDIGSRQVWTDPMSISSHTLSELQAVSDRVIALPLASSVPAGLAISFSVASGEIVPTTTVGAQSWDSKCRIVTQGSDSIADSGRVISLLLLGVNHNFGFSLVSDGVSLWSYHGPRRRWSSQWQSSLPTGSAGFSAFNVYGMNFGRSTLKIRRRVGATSSAITGNRGDIHGALVANGSWASPPIIYYDPNTSIGTIGLICGSATMTIGGVAFEWLAASPSFGVLGLPRTDFDWMVTVED